MNGQSLFRETIFALSTGGLPTGVAVFRLSGPQVRVTLEALCGDLPSPRAASLRSLKDREGQQIDRGLVMFFPSPASFTGEDCGELHVHGSRAVVAALLARLSAMPGLRQAEAGEFTRRAFLNGKIDLTGAEALADLLAAETEAQRRLAVANAEGGQLRLYSGWRTTLVNVRAMIEAHLDFSDQADVEDLVPDQTWENLRSLQIGIAEHISGYSAAEIVRDGFRVALIGAPNSGKSSLLNMLARREAAIVTDIPGTTRDPIEVTLDLDGMKVLVTDTAGLRETQDVIEQIGIDRALQTARQADLVIELTDVQDTDDRMVHDTGSSPIIRIGTKNDLPHSKRPGFDLEISTVTGAGVAHLLQMIAMHARETTTFPSIIPTRLRHVELLEMTRAHIGEALLPKDLELAAEDLRLASECLGRITGDINVEELLGTIFSEFCIGK